jgi:hypothetical protein
MTGNSFKHTTVIASNAQHGPHKAFVAESPDINLTDIEVVLKTTLTVIACLLRLSLEISNKTIQPSDST